MSLFHEWINPSPFISFSPQRGSWFSLQKYRIIQQHIKQLSTHNAPLPLVYVWLHLSWHFPLLLVLSPSIQMRHSLIIFKQSNQFTIGSNLVLDLSHDRTQFQPSAAAWIPRHPSLEEALLLWILIQRHEAPTSV